MILLDGKYLSELLKQQLREEVDALHAKGLRSPHLCAILVGEITSSTTYVNSKIRSCEQIGYGHSLYKYDENVSEQEILEKIAEINNNNEIDGLIVQLPLPAHISVEKIIEAVSPEKDADGFHPLNIGRMVNSGQKVRQGYITVMAGGDIVTDFNATPVVGMAPLTVSFSDNSTGSPTMWAWDFGDGSIDIVQNPVHTYKSPGEYTVKLSSSDAFGHSSDKMKVGFIKVVKTDEIVADFLGKPLNGTAPLSVRFNDTSIGTPTMWAWDFGDGATDGIANTSHIYKSAGTYTVKMTASNQYGASSEKIKQNYINVSPQPTLSPSPTATPIPNVPQSFYGSISMYGEPIQSGGTVEARVTGYDLVGVYNPIKTAKGVFGKEGTLSPKLQVQSIPVGSQIEFWVSDKQHQLTRAYVRIGDGPLKWGVPYEPGKELEIRLIVSNDQPTVIPTIPVTPIETKCPGVPSMPMVFAGDCHIVNGSEYLDD